MQSTGHTLHLPLAAGKPLPKKIRVLQQLLTTPLNRFDAEKYPVSDHCLPSTVSELKKKGLTIHCQLICVAGFDGGVAHIAEYRLDPLSRETAKALLRSAGIEVG
jgi:hypothetical protein